MHTTEFRRPERLLLVLVLLIAATTAPATAEILIFRVSGEPVVASTIRMNGAELTVEKAGEAARALPLDSILGIDYTSRDPRTKILGARVLLAGGDVVTGRIESGDEFDLRILTATGVLEIAVDDIREVRFPALEQVRRAARAIRPSDESDKLLRSNGKGLDVVEGTLISFTPDKVIFAGPVGNYPFDHAEVASVLLIDDGGMAAPETPGSYVQVHLVDGSRYTGALAAMTTDKLSVETSKLGRLEIPAGLVTSVGFYRESFVYLSDLEPVEVQQTPFFGDDASFLFRYQRDTTVTGAPLLIDGLRYQKGLGVHSRSRLTYALDGGYKTFHATVGVSDEVKALPAAGRVAFRVLLDGKVAYESAVLEAGKGSLALPAIELGSARTLSLEVDFGGDSDAGDRAIWANPVLTR